MLRLASIALLALAQTVTAPPLQSGQYAARRDGDVVRLQDRGSATAVTILPFIGNLAVEMTVKGHNVLRFPYESIEDYKSRKGGSIGIPFLAPWADRLDEQAFYANGRRYSFDMSLGNVRGSTPIHGFLGSTDQWVIKELNADESSAWITSRLEFFRTPDWMRQFPFAHTIEMTHRLRDGELELETRIDNHASEPMPVAIGFHPYFQLTDSPRDEWTVSVAAKTHWPLTGAKMPAGHTQPIGAFFPNPAAVPLKDFDLDDVFSDLVRDDDGRAVMSLKGRSQQLNVMLGRKYRAIVIYAPKPATAPPAPGRGATTDNRNFVCLEPVAGIINALNLAHRGVYSELQYIPPGGSWRESFWIRPSGF
jgi:aldose 1-epimerase